MTYNAKEYKVVDNTVEPGTVLEGYVVSIQDGTAKEFVAEKAKASFKNLESKAINVVIETKYKDKPLKINRVFTYDESDGKMAVNPKSNLGKYMKLPEVGDKVKLISNTKGFFELMLLS